MKDKRFKYHQQSHVSDILWHFIGPCEFEGYDYKKAVGRLDSAISKDGDVIELGPFKENSSFYLRQLSLFQQRVGNDEVPSEEYNYIVKEPKALCFCDIPIGSLPLHMDKYGDIGIGIRRRKVNDLFFDILKPVRYYPYISVETLARENSKLWNVSDKEIILDDFVKIPTLLDPDAISISGTSEPFEYIYQEREWRCVEKIKLSVNEISYILLPNRSYISEEFPRLRKLIQHGVGVILAQEMYRLNTQESLR